MKVNKTTYLLLVLVLAIWGYFIVSLVGDLSGGDDIENSALSIESTVSYKANERETFELIENPRDPFLGKATKKQKSANSPSFKTNTSATNWPNVVYKGSISGVGNATRFVLAVNGNEHLLSKGQSAAKLTLISGSEEEVKLGYEGQTKTFTKQ